MTSDPSALDDEPEVFFYNVMNTSASGYGQQLQHQPPKSWRDSMPCTCQDFTCGCCAGIRMQTFNIDQTGYIVMINSEEH
uniref:Uncharacterized protein n=1 Tax=Timema douglasi TaxID=61478 RepID=A0A7R8VZ16_TIMDO|nr:unnamed protein product [Timema douglasi]